jgi:hypothetical protein
MWLGSISPRRYYLLSATLAGGLFVLLYWSVLDPIWHLVSETRYQVIQLEEYKTRKITLLRQIREALHDGKHARLHMLTDHDEALKELVLERIHRCAAQAGVVVTDFSERLREINFSGHGEFSQIRVLVNLLSGNEARFVISSITLENTKWPDFDGQLQMRVQVKTAVEG